MVMNDRLTKLDISDVLTFVCCLLSSAADATTSLPSNPSKVIPAQEALRVMEVAFLRKVARSEVFSIVRTFLRLRLGTIGGILGIDDRPRFHEYVVHQHHPSYRSGDFRVGAILPPDGVTYYDIPGEYHVQGYRYAYVNDHAVLVDPRTRQIVEIID
jgi:hypothetical protein